MDLDIIDFHAHPFLQQNAFLCHYKETLPMEPETMYLMESSLLSQCSVYDYESGKTRIPVDCLLILAKFYDVSLDYITGASDIPNKYPKK